MERLINLLKANKEVNDFKIEISSTHSYQLFFVKDSLETNRISDSHSATVSVYTDVGEFRGTGTFDYEEFQSDEEIIAAINEALFNARLALNPFFELPKQAGNPIVLESNLKDREFSEIAKDVAKAIFSNEMDDVLYSAATEIFINKVDTRIINSQGLDVSETRYYGEAELIPSYDTSEKEVEIYHMMRFSNFNFDDIKNETAEILQIVKDRYNAIDLPKNLDGTNIIIDGEEVGQVFGYFSQDLDYSAKFFKTNLCELDNNIQGENVQGSVLNMWKSPYYPGASGSRSIDGDGIALKEIQVVKNGIAINRHGDNAIGYYLKVKNITGNLPITIVGAGQKSFDDFKKEPYIRCVRFSAMQMDRLSGLVGGEVRLGYYFDGEKEIPVTGFTFTGNLHELKGMIEYSKEEVTYSRYHGPKYLLLPKTKII